MLDRLYDVILMVLSGFVGKQTVLFLLNPPTSHLPTVSMERSQDPRTPSYATDLKTWVCPFFMGPINTRIVRRSNALYDQWQDSYGANFTYQEYFKVDGPMAKSNEHHRWAGSLCRCFDAKGATD